MGNRGRALTRAALATGEVEIVAFADPHTASRQSFASLAPDARKCATADDLLGLSGMDAVLIATPNDRHTQVVLQALEAGLHVLCEKPLAPTMEEIDRLAEAAMRANRILQVGMELRHSPLFRRMRELVTEGCIGVPKMLWCHEFRPPFKPGVDGWRLEPAASGGTLLEKNCHHFDLFNWLAGSRPVRVHAVGSNDTLYADRGMLDRAWVTLEYASGAQASLGLSLFFDRQEQLQLGVVGTRGKLTVDEPPGALVLESLQQRLVEEYPTPEGFAHGGEIEQQRAFLHSIRNGERLVADVESAKWSHVVSLAAELSVQRGLPVAIDERARLVV